MNISTFRAFQSRNYTLFFCGQGTSQIGTWMQATAVSWMVYSITHDPFMLGFTVFASRFPMFLFSPLGGIASDRYDRKKILLITQTLSMIQAILLALLIFNGHYYIWQILTLSAILGVINAFDSPARQPLVSVLIKDKDDLPNALALNSSMVNSAVLIGPALAGLVLVKFGAAICFLANAISFVAVLISLLLIKIPPFVPSTVKKHVITDLREGFVYLKNTPSIGILTLMLALVCLLVTPFNTLLPIFAKEVFKGDAATFGYINSFLGLGALVGAFFLASLKRGSDLKFVLLINTLLFGGSLMLFAETSLFPLAMVFATLTGFGMMAQVTICNTIVQVESAPEMRGRVISYLIMAITGMLPLGSLLIGFIAKQLSAQTTLLCQGIIAITIAVVFSKFLRADKLNKKEQEKLQTA